MTAGLELAAGFVVISGASRSLGRALARGFVATGWTVAGCGRDASRLDELARALGAPHDFQPVDVTSDAVDGWAVRLLERSGPPDLLINNAGIINRPAPLWRVPPDEFSDVVDVNVKGVYRVLRAFLPAMLERGRGVLVNVSSGWGRTTAPEVAPYCATKFAIEGMTRALAQELPEGMAAVSLNPGIIDTDMLRTAWSDGAAAYPPAGEWAAQAVFIWFRWDRGTMVALSAYPDRRTRLIESQERTMEKKFKKLTLHRSEKAEETWVNLDHVVAVTPDPEERFMVVVLDTLDLGGFSWGPKIYRATYESGRELLGS